ncbi:hypothetical protein LCGC14_0349680 [marine sediment metagenome]|uniref:LamG-like jellyroll fold domain-containing protein n=1 Tax=marine sediment metagenome TaxID=412755 RepID=A0A0F9VYF1_9ZZZZ
MGTEIIALRYSKSLWSYNPIPRGCVLHLPAWHPSLKGPVFKSPDPYGHTGTVTGATHGDDGWVFDGDDVITVTNPTGIPVGSEARTMLIWVKPDDFVVGSNHIFVYGTFSNNEYCGLFIQETTGEFKFGGHTNNADSGFNLTAGISQLIGITYALDATDILFYVNGDLKNTDALSSAAALNTASGTDLLVGKGKDTPTFLTGSVGDVWVYNRALSTDEMLYIYNRTRGRY